LVKPLKTAKINGNNIKLLKLMILHRSRRNESAKHVCYYENCYKEYGTKGALVFHIKHKHKELDPIKKDHINISKHSKSNYSFGKLLNDAKNFNGIDFFNNNVINQDADKMF